MVKDASPWQKQALNKLDASSMETTRIREPQGPLVASSLRSECYSPGPLRLSNVRSFLDSTSNYYIDHGNDSQNTSYGILTWHCLQTETAQTPKGGASAVRLRK